MAPSSRPDIYRFHDYRAFLKEWIDYQKSIRPGFSMRVLSGEAGLSVGYLPPILSGKRPISMKALYKLFPVLDLSRPEQVYLENLVKMGSAVSQETRIEAVTRMKSSTAYQRRNPKESELVEYLSRWYHVAIRELAGAPGFRADAEWIQKQLKTHVPTANIDRALGFLLKHGYLKVDSDGKVQAPKERVECEGRVYKVALTNFHRQMFGLAAESIDQFSAADRDVVGHTMVISEENFEHARGILRDALGKIQKLSGVTEKQRSRGDGSVYHVELAIFPLTNKGKVP